MSLNLSVWPNHLPPDRSPRSHGPKAHVRGSNGPSHRGQHDIIFPMTESQTRSIERDISLEEWLVLAVK